ncbi:predicted protein, partial [Arabidopsis lyrata subsp. lyrata]
VKSSLLDIAETESMISFVRKLSLMYMPMMELGVSSNMFDIKKNALKKLSKQQSAYRIKLLSSYKEMVSVTMLNLVNLGNLFSCYLESIKKTLEKCRFGTCHIDMITKKMAEEFVEMFIREVMIK